MKDLFARAVGEFDAPVRQVGEEQWHAPTPCAEWDLHALVNHLVNERVGSAGPQAELLGILGGKD